MGTRGLSRLASAMAAGSVVVAACTGGGGSSTPTNRAEAPRAGGTLRILSSISEFGHVDPQRVYTQEDSGIFSAFLLRSLTTYQIAPGEAGATVVPDLATDLGRRSPDAKQWSFTLRDGLFFEDGTPVTCASVKYGVSRSFATDVITAGPTYALRLLDIPRAANGESTYKGPYAAGGSDAAAFDRAVTCSKDDKTITFRLRRPAPDFNYTTTLLAFGPVPKAADTGQKYDDGVLSTGPYKIEEYSKGRRMLLVRNPRWNPATDPVRKAYPDQIVVEFGLQRPIEDQRLMAGTGEDAFAVGYDKLTADSVPVVFGSDEFAVRRWDEMDANTDYIAINTVKVPNIAHRKAILAAMDREQLLAIGGGSRAGQLADGVIKPNLPLDYRPSGLWSGLLDAPIPNSGDPELAKRFLAEAGSPIPTLTYDYPTSTRTDQAAGAIIASLAKAGITVKPNPMPLEEYFDTVQKSAQVDSEIAFGSWGPDWKNGSTIIPELFTAQGSFNLSYWSDREFSRKVDQALAELDRTQQGAMWAELNKEAMARALVVPTRFSRQQRLAGTKVRGGFPYAPYSGWAYAALWLDR